MKFKFLIVVMAFFLLVLSCKEEPIPKPKAQIRLEYPPGKLATIETKDFTFQYNEFANIESSAKEAVTLSYPNMNGAIFINYKRIEDNLDKLIKDAKRLSYEHATKADNIVEQPYVNPKAKVYGALFEVQGDAASQSQFYMTDSTEHFLTGAVYFSSKPNYDSILPAAAYLQNDIRRIIESIKWK